MAQIINGQPNLGGLLGQGLSEGITQLANHKLRVMTQKAEKQRSFDSLRKAGFSEQDSELLSNYGPEVQEKLLRNLWQRGGGQAEQQGQQQNPLESMLGGQQQQNPQGQPDINQLLGGGLNGQQQAQNAGQLLNPNANELIRNSLAKSQIQGIGGAPELPLQQVQPQQQQLQVPQQESAAQTFKRPPVANNSSQQKGINSNNAPYLKKLDKAVDLADNLETIATEMQTLLDSGKVSSGLRGSITPGVLQNPETQQFEALSNELASILASQSGVATNFKIKLAQSTKPNLSQKPETQRALIGDILKKAEKLKSYGTIRDQLIAENNGEQPSNIQRLINERINAKSGSQEQSDLPPVSEYSNGSIIEVDGKQYQRNGNKWVEPKRRG